LFIRAQDINTDRLRFDGIAHVKPPQNSEGSRTRVQVADLLVTVTGANVTKTALVDLDLGEAYVSQHVALVRPVDALVALWLLKTSKALECLEF
jgi:type I restriction enzyme S subunit